jgi:MFS transporter, PAT family, beta-lactamase induction signal transducer AmpG
VRSTFYRLAMIGGQGGLVALAGWWQDSRGSAGGAAWTAVFWLLAAGFGLLALYHAWALPRPPSDRPAPRAGAQGGSRVHFGRDFGAVFAAFFAKPDIVRILAFLLLYRIAEAQLLKLVCPSCWTPRPPAGWG